MDGQSEETWAERRRETAAYQADRLARERAEESEQARALIRQFVTEAVAAGVPAEELKAVDSDGHRYRTGLRGWVLRNDGRSAIGEDGSFYLLGFVGGARARLAARLRGVQVEPSDPPLVMGRGGRDGESIPLAELLDRLLGRGDSGPAVDGGPAVPQ